MLELPDHQREGVQIAYAFKKLSSVHWTIRLLNSLELCVWLFVNDILDKYVM